MSIQRIRDPLHNIIEFGSTELEKTLWKVLQTRPLQRLRRVKQLGFSELVYPGATHTRLAHSIGVFHTARQLMDVIKRSGDTSDSRAHRALAAALVHDVGHGPFSHAFETVGRILKLKMADHEHVSDLLIRHGEIAEKLNEMGSGFAQDVADIIKKEGKITVHNAVVSSQFDADRLDYMRRDRLMTGTRHAEIDFPWLMANIEIGSVPTGVDDTNSGAIDTFVLGPKAVHAAEGYVLGLFQLYPTVYFHKATRGAEQLFVAILVRIFELVRSDHVSRIALSNQHPLVRFARNPDSIEIALELDDSVIWGALSSLAASNDPLLREFCVRLRDRKLFKCVDIRAKVAHALDPEMSGNPERVAKIERCCELIKQSLTELNSEMSLDVPKMLIDEATRSPYKDGHGSGYSAERINIRTDGGQVVDLKRRSRLVRELEVFRLLRVYHSPDDVEVLELINRTIDEEVNRDHH